MNAVRQIILLTLDILYFFCGETFESALRSFELWSWKQTCFTQHRNSVFKWPVTFLAQTKRFVFTLAFWTLTQTSSKSDDNKITVHLSRNYKLFYTLKLISIYWQKHYVLCSMFRFAWCFRVGKYISWICSFFNSYNMFWKNYFEHLHITIHHHLLGLKTENKFRYR